MRDRILDLDRVLNFRDFGGYPTRQGALKRGVLFRSASFQDATDADIARLDALGVRFLVDLRRPEERNYEPNRWPGAAVRCFTNGEGVAAGLPPHLLALLQDDISEHSIRAYMRKLYADMPSDPRLIGLYRTWFAELGAGEGGAVIHCAAGKDRTGLGCALTLYALGAGEDDIIADYEFTNAVLDLDKRMARIKPRIEERVGRKLDEAALRPMMGVEADYLRTAFDAIEAKHGSIDAYLGEVLGVGEKERARLQTNLLG